MKKIIKITANPLFWLGIIVFFALLIRLYKIDSPIADWHSWRQADTASVTRSFVQEGFNPFYPKYDDLSGAAERPSFNLGRYRFVEFPIYNIATYPLYLLFGVQDKYSRLVSVLFSLGSIVLIYFITKRHKDTSTALVASSVFAFLPFNIFFSRSTLPEPTFVFFALGMIYFVNRSLDEGNKWLGVGLVFSIITFLIKPWGIFFALPLLYLIIKKESSLVGFLKFKYLFFAFVAFLPFLVWRIWINQFPEGIPASSWLYNSDGIRFRPAFWWWLVQSRIGGEILSVPGAILFALGVILRPTKNYFFHFWLLSILLYFAIFATGNVRHNYYQVLFVPIASIFTGIGIVSLIRGTKIFIPRFWTIALVSLLIPLMFYFSWKSISGFYQINNYPIVEAGIKANEILPKNARVIAPYNGDTAFLYQINRPGWPLTPLPIKELILDYGATHYISTSLDAKTNWVKRYFVVLEENPNFVIADLTRLKVGFVDSDTEP